MASQSCISSHNSGTLSHLGSNATRCDYQHKNTTVRASCHCFVCVCAQAVSSIQQFSSFLGARGQLLLLPFCKSEVAATKQFTGISQALDKAKALSGQALPETATEQELRSNEGFPTPGRKFVNSPRSIMRCRCRCALRNNMAGRIVLGYRALHHQQAGLDHALPVPEIRLKLKLITSLLKHSRRGFLRIEQKAAQHFSEQRMQLLTQMNMVAATVLFKSEEQT